MRGVFSSLSHLIAQIDELDRKEDERKRTARIAMRAEANQRFAKRGKWV